MAQHLRKGWNIYEGASIEPKTVEEVECPAHLLPDFCARRIMQGFLSYHGLFAHLIDSMDEFVATLLPHIVAEQAVLIIVSEKAQCVHAVTIRPPTEIRKPQKRESRGYLSNLSVREARDRGLTYEATLIMDYVHDVWEPVDGVTIRLPRVRRGRRTVSSDDLVPEAMAFVRPLPGLEEGADPDFELESILNGMSPLSPTWFPERTCDELREDGDPLVSSSAQRPLTDWASSNEAVDQDWTPPTHRFKHTSRIVCQDPKHFSIPVMVGSNACHTRDQPPLPGDPWSRAKGYFVVNGQEKVIIPQVNPAVNTMFTHRSIKDGIQHTTGEMRCCQECKIRSTSTVYINVQSAVYGTGSVNANVMLPYLEKSIPLLALLRVIGFQSVEGAARVIAHQGRISERDDEARSVNSNSHTMRFELWLQSMLRNRAKHEPDFESMTRAQVVDWVGGNCIKRTALPEERPRHVHHVTCNEFLPQCGMDTTHATMRAKRSTFALLIWRTCRVVRHELPPHDRDHFANLMIELPGRLIAKLLRQHYRNRIKSLVGIMKQYVDAKKMYTIDDLSVGRHITNSMIFALSTGAWGVDKNGSATKGVAQPMKRWNIQASLSQLRSMKKPGNTKDIAPRQLRTYDWGIACPSETSEGENCGLLKHFATLTYVCLGRPTQQLLNIACSLLPVHPVSESCAESCGLVINGIVVGNVATDVESACATLRQARRQMLLPFDTSIWIDGSNLLRMSALHGTTRRLLLRQGPSCLHKTRQLCMTLEGEELFKHLLRDGLVEYISKEEESNLIIRLDPTQDLDSEEQPFLHYWASPDDPTGEHADELEEFYTPLHNDAYSWDEVQAELDRVHPPSDDELFSAPSEPTAVNPGVLPYLELADQERCAFFRALHSKWEEQPSVEYVQEELSGVSDQRHPARPILASLLSRNDSEWCDAFRAYVVQFGDRVSFGRYIEANHLPQVETDSRQYGARNTEAQRRMVWSALVRHPVSPSGVERAKQYWRHLARIRARSLKREELFCAALGASNTGTVVFSHSEVHPTAIHSLVISMVVFADRNQAPRNTYQAAMGKAAIAMPQEADEGRSYSSMPCAQVPLVQTVTERMLGPQHLRSGVNCMVAIMTHRGDNQEDSLYACQDDMDRGMFRTWHHHVYTDTATKGYRSDSQKFEFPGEDVLGKRNVSYDLLNERGMVEPGTRVQPGSAIIGKTVSVSAKPGSQRTPSTRTQTPKTKLSSMLSGGNGGGSGAAEESVVPDPEESASIKRDQSLIVKDSEQPGTVTSVMHSKTRDKQRVKVQIARMGVPIVGDKLSARHGQKGVIGDLLSAADMPWGVQMIQTDNGVKQYMIRPNLLLNTNALPSRMTIGQLFEMMAASAAAMGGYIADGTSFQRQVTHESVMEELERVGLKRNGRVQLYSGTTGKPLGNCEIFVGMCYYQCLKQRVVEKWRALERGRRSVLTHQPIEGKEGGLRLGEMERDGLVAHGAAHIVLDAFLVRSDDYITHVCCSCGLLGDPPREMPSALDKIQSLRETVGWCRACESAEGIKSVRLPYAFKLFTQELMAQGILPRIHVESSRLKDLSQAAGPGMNVDMDQLPPLLTQDDLILDQSCSRTMEEESDDEASVPPPFKRRPQAVPRSAAWDADFSGMCSEDSDGSYG